jgi:outer membrane immunogenic protein
MKRSLSSIFAMSAGIILASTIAASAADIPVKAAPMAPSAPSWTGFYLGANVGGVWTRNDGTWNPLPSPAAFNANAITGAIDSSSVAGGFHGGFNWQFAPRFVAGIEGDWTWTGAKNSFTQTWTFFGTSTPGPGTFTTMSAKLDWLASVRARLGFLVTPDLLVYGTGGGAWGKVDYAANNSNAGLGGLLYVTSAAFSNIQSGYVAGGGLEWKFARNWALRGEYLFYRLNGASAVGTAVGFPTFPSSYDWSHMNVNEGRVGVSYQF